MKFTSRLEHREVISLERGERRNVFLQQELGREFHVFDAFDGSARDPSEHFDLQRFATQYGSPPSRGQAGCAISHWQVVESFARSHGPLHGMMLVAEDDVQFITDTSRVIEKILTDGSFDVAVLANPGPTNPQLAFQRMLMTGSQLSLLSRVILTPHALYRLGRFDGNPYCAALYVITRAGARKLVAGIGKDGGRPWTLADDWPLFRERYGLDIKVLRPGLATYQGGSTTRTEESAALDTSASAERPSLSENLKTRIAARSRLRASILALKATRLDMSHRLTSR